MNDMGDVEFLLKEIYRIRANWCCKACENKQALFCPALYMLSEIIYIIQRRYGMEVVGNIDSEEITAKNSVCSVTVRRKEV